MQTYLEQAFAVFCVVVGLSHLVQPREWVAFFTEMSRRPGAALIISMWTLPFGVVFGLGHNDWRWGIPLIVTLFGWAWLLKGSIYALYPRVVEIWARPGFLTPRKFQVGGALMTAIGLLVGWVAWMP